MNESLIGVQNILYRGDYIDIHDAKDSVMIDGGYLYRWCGDKITRIRLSQTFFDHFSEEQIVNRLVGFSIDE